MPAQQARADGSSLSNVFYNDDRARRHGHTVRVIDYELHGLTPEPPRRCRLVTSLLDAGQAPGDILAAL